MQASSTQVSQLSTYRFTAVFTMAVATPKIWLALRVVLLRDSHCRIRIRILLHGLVPLRLQPRRSRSPSPGSCVPAALCSTCIDCTGTEHSFQQSNVLSVCVTLHCGQCQFCCHAMLCRYWVGMLVASDAAAFDVLAFFQRCVVHEHTDACLSVVDSERCVRCLERHNEFQKSQGRAGRHDCANMTFGMMSSQLVK